MIRHNPALFGHIAFWSLISLTLFLIVPAFALDDISWESYPIPGVPSESYLFLWITAGTLSTTGLYRLYSTLVRRRSTLDPADLASMPQTGVIWSENVYAWIQAFVTHERDLQWLKNNISSTQRWTPNTDYNLPATNREALARLLGNILVHLDKLEALHSNQLEGLEEFSNKIKDVAALPDDTDVDELLRQTDEALILAKHCRKLFQEWYPNDSDLSGDHVWLELNTEIDMILNTKKDYEHQLNQIKDICNRQYGVIPTIWDNLENMIQDTKNVAQNYAAAIHDVYPNILIPMIDPTYLKGLLTSLKNNADLTPIGNLLKPSARPVPLEPSSLAIALKDALEHIRTTIQAVYPQETLENFDNLDQFLQNATKWSNRATGYFNRMSGQQATGTAQTMTLQQIWNEIPAGMRPLGGNCYTDLDQFKAWLNHLARPYNPQPPAACNHPVELATELGDPVTQEWNDSLTHVRDLVNNQPPVQNRPVPPNPQPNPQPYPAPGNHEPLFRTSDLPKFGDEDDYWTYRRSMTIFCESIAVAPALLAMAMARIIASFTGERRKKALAFDLADVYQPTWELTWPALLRYMDNHFLDRNAWIEQYNHWVGLRYNDKTWGREFVSLYIQEHATLNQIGTVKGKRIIPDSEAVQKLVDRVPRKVNEQLYYKHPDWSTLRNQFQVYEWIIEEWEHARRMGYLERKTKEDKPALARSMQIPVNSPGNPNPGPQWKELICDKPCFDTNPPVHPSLRGPWRELKPDQQRGLHSRCRRPISEHGKGIKGCPQAGQHLFHKGTNTDPAPPNRQITQGKDEDAQVTPTVRFAENSGNE